MTKHENVTVEQAKDDSALVMSVSTEAVAPDAEGAAVKGPETSKPEAGKKHGPTTTMMSGWAQGGSSAT